MSSLKDIVDEYPKLNINGFGANPRYINSGMSHQEIEENFQKDKEALLREEDEFNRSVAWIKKNLWSVKNSNSKRTSNGIRSIASLEIGEVSNGAFIAAMIHCGFVCRRHAVQPWPRFNVSDSSIRQSEKRLKTREKQLLGF